jgi:hypothetical protein
MFCPQCGTESSSGLQFCRSCGANLKVIGKAVTLSEAIARSDRGPLPKIKEMMKSLKIEQVSNDISHALDQMNQEIMKNSGSLAMMKPKTFQEMVESRYEKRREKKEKTAAQRRESHITHGLISLFSGLGLMIFLYFLSSSLVLKIPERILAQAPFDIDSAVNIIWLVGLMPALTGVGRILAGLSIRPEPESLDTSNNLRSEISDLKTTNELAQPNQSAQINGPADMYEPPSVTERTTNILNRR